MDSWLRHGTVRSSTPTTITIGHDIYWRITGTSEFNVMSSAKLRQRLVLVLQNSRDLCGGKEAIQGATRGVYATRKTGGKRDSLPARAILINDKKVLLGY